MKNLILRASTVGFALLAAMSVGCSSSGCSGTNLNDNSNTSPTQLHCPDGYTLSSNQCIKLPGTSSSKTSTTVN